MIYFSNEKKKLFQTDLKCFYNETTYVKGKKTKKTVHWKKWMLTAVVTVDTCRALL